MTIGIYFFLYVIYRELQEDNLYSYASPSDFTLYTKQCNGLIYELLHMYISEINSLLLSLPLQLPLNYKL